MNGSVEIFRRQRDFIRKVLRTISNTEKIEKDGENFHKLNQEIFRQLFPLKFQLTSNYIFEQREILPTSYSVARETNAAASAERHQAYDVRSIWIACFSLTADACATLVPA